MHISKLTAAGLKGLSFSHELSQRVLITGPNYSGKTARLDAIRLALVGYHDELGKTGPASLKLAQGGRMEAKLELSDGNAIIRRFVKGESPHTTATDEALFASIAASPLMNQQEYFTLSDKAQVDYIFAHTKALLEFTPEHIISAVRGLKLEQDNELTEAARQSILETVRLNLEKHGVNDGLTKLTEKGGPLKTLFTTYSAKAKEAVGAMRTLTELKLREGECSADTLAEIESELSEARQANTLAQQAYGAITAKQEAIQKAARRRGELEAWIADRAPVSSDDLLAVNKELITALTAEIAKDEARWDGDVDKYRAMHLMAARELEEAEGVAEKHEKDAEDAQHEINDLNHREECPHCKSKSKGWKNKLLATLTAELKQANKLAEEERNRVNILEAAETAAGTLYGERQASWQRCENGRRRIANLEAECEALQFNYDHALEKWNGWKAELAALPVNEDEWTTSDTARQEAEAAQAKLTAIEQRKTTAIQLQQDLRREAQAAQEGQKAEAYVVVIKVVGKYLADLKAELVESTFAGLLNTANRIFPGEVFTTPLAYHDGTLGRWSGSHFISHETFTGAEKALTYIALSAALSTTSPLRLVMLDEVSRLDKEKAPLVLSLLDQAITRGDLDQVIVCQPIATSDIVTFAPSGDAWQLISL